MVVPIGHRSLSPCMMRPTNGMQESVGPGTGSDLALPSHSALPAQRCANVVSQPGLFLHLPCIILNPIYPANPLCSSCRSKPASSVLALLLTEAIATTTSTAYPQLNSTTSSTRSLCRPYISRSHHYSASSTPIISIPSAAAAAAASQRPTALAPLSDHQPNEQHCIDVV